MSTHPKTRMNPLLSALAVALVALTSPAAEASQVGAGRDFGLGVTLGAPSGLSMKIFMANQHALDIAVGVGYTVARLSTPTSTTTSTRSP